MQPSVLDHIHLIEKEIGPLSKSQRALLITDGSVTRLLEVFCDAPVGVKTECQKIVSATEDLANILKISSGSDINLREVFLFNKKNQEILIRAISYAPLSHLPKGAVIRLMKEDEPIGNIMRDEQMESRREIVSIKSSLSPSSVFNRRKGSEFLRCINKSYRIIHKNNPIFYIEEMIPQDLFANKKTVRIKTPSRLHIGLLDMNGSRGRIDGGAGITLDTPGFDFEITESDLFMVTSDDPEVTKIIRHILDRLKNNGLIVPPVHIHIYETIPFHSGLGSGTQAALGLAAGISSISGRLKSEEELISLSGRGGTSGIGTRAFFHGGFLVDAGHRYGPGKCKSTFAPSSASSGAGVAPLIGRYEIPANWTFIIAIPDDSMEVCGKMEQDIFQTCCPVPEEDVQKLSHILLMQLIPSILEQDLDQFGKAINEFQNYGFKKCETDLQPPVISDIIETMKNAGASGAGMSSFGPVVYGICDTGSSEIIAAAEQVLNEHSGGTVLSAKGRNRGADINTYER